MKATAIRSLGLICLLVLSCYAQRVVESLPVEVATGARLLVPIAIDVSPDGLWVAYTLSDPRRRKVQGRPSDLLSVFNCTGAPHAFADHDVLITNTKTGETTNISSGKGASWGPSWSPDGKSLAFYSDRSGKAHIWIWERSTKNLRPLTAAVVHVRLRFEKILWSADSRQVFTKILGDGQPLDGCFDPGSPQKLPDDAARTVYESETPNTQLPPSTETLLADLAVLDIASGKLKRLVRQRKIAGYSLSPAGDKIAFSTPKRVKPTDEFLLIYDLVVVSLPDGQVETVRDFSPGTPSLPASWSPDGRSLAYISERECFVWQLSGQPQKVTAGPRSGFAQMPLWHDQGRTIYLVAENRIWRVSVADAKAVPITQSWDRQIRSMIARTGGREIWSPDGGQSIYIGTNNPQTKQDGFYKVDLRNGNLVKLIESDSIYNLALTGVSTRKDLLVYAAQSSQRDQNLWVAGLDFASPKQLTHINAELERYPAGEARLIDYSDSDGKKLQATLLLPAKYQKGRRYPLIVWVYGGSMLSSNVNRYGSASNDHHNLQILSSRGYAVLLPDTPLRVGTPMLDLAKTVLPAVDKTIEMGVADADKLGVMGISYGGYSTLALIVQTKRFKAAVMDVGFGNVISSYGVMLKNGMPLGVGWAEEGQGRMGGPPWEFPERYVQNSPLFYLNKVDTPLLITQGGMDVSPYQSDEIFVGLRRLGKKVVYVRYENEGHGIELHENRIDYWRRVINWFESHLNNQSRAPSSSN